MSRFHKLYRIGLITILGVILILPVIEKHVNYFETKPLSGYVAPLDDVYLSLESWFSADFQERQDKVLAENFGFRNTLVRLYNEANYSLFHKSSSPYLVVGKEDYLYEEWYIKAHYGLDYIGADSIRKKLEMLKRVQDTLTALNKTLITIYAPGKAAFYPEFIPYKWTKLKKDSNNISVFEPLSKRLGINHIDFHSFFIEQRGKLPYPLYPKNGTHWSFYGMCLAADSMVKYIENSCGIDMPNVYWDSVVADTEREYDYDIANAMNLYNSAKGLEMGYPNVKVQQDTSLDRPSTIIVSDSYYFGIFNFGLHQAFRNNRLRYYNKRVLPDSYTEELSTSSISLKNEIKDNDIFIIVSTDVNLPRLGWGYIEDLYKIFFETPADSPKL